MRFQWACWPIGSGRTHKTSVGLGDYFIIVVPNHEAAHLGQAGLLPDAVPLQSDLCADGQCLAIAQIALCGEGLETLQE